MREFNNKQSVKVIADYNQFKACSNTVYHVETTNRINGQYSVDADFKRQNNGCHRPKLFNS